MSKLRLVRLNTGEARLMSEDEVKRQLARSKGGRTAHARGTRHKFTSKTARAAALKAWATRWRRLKYSGVRAGRPRKQRPAVDHAALRRYYNLHPTLGISYCVSCACWWQVSAEYEFGDSSNTPIHTFLVQHLPAPRKRYKKQVGPCRKTSRPLHGRSPYKSEEKSVCNLDRVQLSGNQDTREFPSSVSVDSVRQSLVSSSSPSRAVSTSSPKHCEFSCPSRMRSNVAGVTSVCPCPSYSHCSMSDLLRLGISRISERSALIRLGHLPPPRPRGHVPVDEGEPIINRRQQ